MEYKAPGEEFLRPLAEFWKRTEFWRLQPNHTAMVFSKDLVWAAMAAADRSLAVGYVCTQKTTQKVQDASVQLRLPNGVYRLTLLRPADGKVLEVREHRSQGLHRPEQIKLPAFTDDLMVKLVEASQFPTPTR